jgi:hypothetical protein
LCMPMFHIEHCMFAPFLSTGKDFCDCGRPSDVHRVELWPPVMTMADTPRGN